jgi:hypothetical protein
MKTLFDKLFKKARYEAPEIVRIAAYLVVRRNDDG